MTTLHAPLDLVKRLRLASLTADGADHALLAEAAQKIEQLQQELDEARKDEKRLHLACEGLDGFLFDPMCKADYIREIASARGHRVPTTEDELEAIRRMIDFQLDAFEDKH